MCVSLIYLFHFYSQVTMTQEQLVPDVLDSCAKQIILNCSYLRRPPHPTSVLELTDAPVAERSQVPTRTLQHLM